MKLEDINSIEYLKEYLLENDIDKIRDLQGTEYKELYYRKFKNYVTEFLVKEKRYSQLVWHSVIKRVPIVTKLVCKLAGKNKPEAYFNKKPFFYEYLFSYDQGIESSKLFNNMANNAEVSDIYQNIDDYIALSNDLEDKASKDTLINILQYRLSHDTNFVIQAFDRGAQYFDHDIIQCGKDEVFVDCGGFIGDTVIEFIKSFKSFKSIHMYEPNQEIADTARKNLEKYDNYENIHIHSFGVSDINKRVSFSSEPFGGSLILESNSNENFIDVISLDDDIKEEITFIKMDIEGEELNALKGARNHIVRDCPKLAICVYHNIDDIISIQKYIKSINSNYKYYLRHYTMGIFETVLYAVPR